MYVNFYLDDIFYSGLVTARYNGAELFYYADLTNETPFKIYLAEAYYFISDTPGRTELANAIGKEIMLRDEMSPAEAVKIRRYLSENGRNEKQLVIRDSELVIIDA